MAGLLSLPAVAQVKVTVQLNGSWQNVVTCPSNWQSGGLISLSETQTDDFYGKSGNAHTYTTLHIALPPGLAFDPQGATTWSNANSADLQNGSGPVSYSWQDVDAVVNARYPSLNPQLGDLWPATFPGEVNTLTITGLEVKNTGKRDSLFLLPIRIKVLPTNGNGLPPSGNFVAWTTSENGPARGNDLNAVDAYIRGLPFIGPVAGLPDPIISTIAGPASGMKFLIEPAAAPVINSVQGRIIGDGVNSWPTLQAVDCNGYSTGVGLTGLGRDVTLTLLDGAGSPVSSDAALWTSASTGPTYAGAVITPTPHVSTGWQTPAGTMALTFSVDAVSISEQFKIRATSVALGTVVSTNAFTVSQGLVSWVSQPDLDTPVSNGSVFDIYMSGGPQASVLNHYAQGVTSAPTRMELHNANAVPSYNRLFSVQPAPYSEQVGSLAGSAIFTNNAYVFSLTPAQLNPKPDYSAVAFVTTTQYQGVAPGFAPLANTGIYLDPRYVIANELIANNGLPVELTTFTASLRNQTVSLKWSTATETNNYGFDVERSDDGATWTKIGFVAGNGTTSSQRDYGFTNRLTETDMMRPTLSYRLRQIDRDGTFEYSPVVTVALAPAASSVKLMQNFPNPFNPSTNIAFNLPEAGSVTMTVYNELGLEVVRLLDNASFESGWHTASFNASELPSGVYMYSLQTAAGTTTKTMIVSK